MECPALEPITDGDVSNTGNDYQSIAKYLCNSGYTLNGPSERVCQISGEWSLEEPSCEGTDMRMFMICMNDKDHSMCICGMVI